APASCPGGPAEDLDPGPGSTQPLHHRPAERTGSARDQDRCCHDVSFAGGTKRGGNNVTVPMPARMVSCAGMLPAGTDALGDVRPCEAQLIQLPVYGVSVVPGGSARNVIVRRVSTMALRVGAGP